MIEFIEYAVDTNVLINFLISEIYDLDEEESNTVDTFEKTRAANCLIPYFILTELEVTLTKAIPRKLKLNREEINKITKWLKEFMKNFENYGSIAFVDTEVFSISKALYATFKPTSSLSLTDITLAVIARRNKANLLTNDKELMKFYKQLKFESIS